MTRLTLFVSFAFLCLAPEVWARYGADDPRLQKLFATFLSPCCWREELTIHDSPTADEVRGLIRTMVRDGKTDVEIKSALVTKYSPRILTLPEGRSRSWLFWTPWLVVATSVGALVLFLYRLKRRGPPTQSTETTYLLQDEDWEIE